MNDDTQPGRAGHRPIRSFVRREGRLTPAQQRALAELLPRHAIATDGGPLDFAAVFGRRAPVWLEIGFGNGDALVHMASLQPEIDFVGIEVHRPGVGHLLLELEARRLTNVRVICADATEVLRTRVGDAALARVLVFFPDPWPKKRHHKRRLVRPAFVDEVARVLEPDGVLHLATDWLDYADRMRELLGADARFAEAGAGGRPAYRPATRFQVRGERQGHAVIDLQYRRR